MQKKQWEILTQLVQQAKQQQITSEKVEMSPTRLCVNGLLGNTRTEAIDYSLKDELPYTLANRLNH